MEGKIFIDTNVNGQPQIRIEYIHDNDGSDLRDKTLGRFLFGLMWGDPRPKSIPVTLEFGHETKNGIVAFIRCPDDPDSDIARAKDLIGKAISALENDNEIEAKQHLQAAKDLHTLLS